jgi:hypothetical protein
MRSRVLLLALFAAFAFAVPAPALAVKTVVVSKGGKKGKGKKEDPPGDEKGGKKGKEPTFKSLSPTMFQECMEQVGAPDKIDNYLLLSVDPTGRVINAELDDPKLAESPVGTCILGGAKKVSGLNPKETRPTLHLQLAKKK